MSFSDWSVDLNNQSATHKSGFSLQVEGNPVSPSAVIPSQYPDGMPVVEQVRLLRVGIEAIADEAKATRKSSKSAPVIVTQTKSKVKTMLTNKPKRPTLTLKKRDLQNA